MLCFFIFLMQPVAETRTQEAKNVSTCIYEASVCFMIKLNCDLPVRKNTAQWNVLTWNSKKQEHLKRLFRSVLFCINKWRSLLTDTPTSMFSASSCNNSNTASWILHWFTAGRPRKETSPVEISLGVYPSRSTLRGDERDHKELQNKQDPVQLWDALWGF